VTGCQDDIRDPAEWWRLWLAFLFRHPVAVRGRGEAKAAEAKRAADAAAKAAKEDAKAATKAAEKAIKAAEKAEAKAVKAAEKEEAKAVKAPAGVEPKQFAAWTTVARVLLNLDETITRE
jgi:hypothetical protein